MTNGKWPYSTDFSAITKYVCVSLLQSGVLEAGTPTEVVLSTLESSQSLERLCQSYSITKMEKQKLTGL